MDEIYRDIDGAANMLWIGLTQLKCLPRPKAPFAPRRIATVRLKTDSDAPPTDPPAAAPDTADTVADIDILDFRQT